MGNTLEVRDLKIHYKTMRGFAKAVDGISFDIREGEILGVAGESGCGKSTLGNSLVLVKPPMNYVSGAANFGGRNIYTLPPAELNKVRFEQVSIIPQFAMDAMSPTKRIRTFIRDILREHGVDIDRDKAMQEKVQDRFEMLNLKKDVLNMYPIELSGGMKQRVIMIISTLLDPKVLIADEVTSALDVTSQRYVGDMIVKFRDDKIVSSVMFVTHDLSILYDIADRIMVMYAGHIMEVAATETIIRAPKHPYTRALISSLPKPGVRYAETKLKGIEGCPPSLLDIPEGCRFAARCPHATDQCRSATPITEACGEDHSIMCWNWKDIEGGRR